MGRLVGAEGIALCMGSASWGVGVLSETGGCRDVIKWRSGAGVGFLASGRCRGMEEELCRWRWACVSSLL